MPKTTCASRVSPAPCALAVAALSIALLSCGSVSGRYARGTFAYTTDGGGLRGSSDAHLVGFRLETEALAESNFRAGIDAEAWLTDDHLLDMSGGGNSSLTAWDVTPFYAIHPDYGSSMFRAPIRLGLTFQDLRLKLDAPPEEMTWQTVGLRAWVSPELDLIRGAEGSLTLFGEAGYLVGVTTVFGAGLDSDQRNGASRMLSLEGGIRYERGSVRIGGGYEFRQFDSDETDPSAGPVFPGVQHEFEGLFATCGVVF